MTKRILSVILALLLAMTVLVACDKEPAENNGDNNNAAPVAENAVDLLVKANDAFLTNLAPIFGASSADEVAGYFASPEMETITETDPDSGEEFTYEMPKSGPGKLDITDVDTLAYYTLFPADSADKLNSASVFFNMMNMNNGTFAAFELKDAADADALATALQGNITGNMWMCGFPERYLIVKIDNYLVSAFGNADSVNSFKDAITATYEGAVVVHDAAL